MRKFWIRTLVVLAVSGLLGAGCGSDEEPPKTNNITPSNNNKDDAGDVSDSDAADAGDATDGGGQDGGSDADATDNDGGDATTTCPDTPCGADQMCVDGSCVDITPETKCDAAEDLGSLSPGSPLTATGSFDEASDALAASCNDQTDVGEVVYRFQVTEDSRIDYDVTRTSGNFAWAVDFRTDCTDSDTALTCSSSDAAIGLVPAGTEVFMIVEMAQGLSGDFTVELSATAESCPAGQKTCSSGELEVCSGNSQSETFACADTCASSGDACAGNVCAEAISVSSTQTFTGDLGAYSNDFDFDGVSGCANDGGTNIPTPGPDMVFELPGLTTSDTVTIDAETNDSNLNRIFVLSGGCGTPYTCEMVGGSDETFDFTPSADGTYYVVIDKSLNSAGAFNYTLTYK